jgi:flagellin-specific chaperone FliS
MPEPKAKYRLIDTYKDILIRSRQMLDMADRGEWEELVGLQTKFMNLDVMKYVHNNHTLEAHERDEAQGLLGQILEDWAEIKSKLTARRDELAFLIESATYQENHGGLGKVVHTDTYGRDDLRKKAR